MTTPDNGSSTTLVIIPTYNERGNLPAALERLFAAVPSAHVLVVDDGSPDGTGALAEELREQDRRIDVLHRSGKLGLGSAYLAGFAWGIARDFELLVEMDADGSHPAEVLPDMLTLATGAPSERAGGVIGSRWIPGGSVVDWPIHRELLSRSANRYARIMLGLPVHDATAGYRVYRADALQALDLSGVDSRGYCFQVDMTLRLHDLGARIVEHPIQFRDRTIGTSKMSGAIIYEAMLKVTLWGLGRRWRRLRRRLARTDGRADADRETIR